MNIGAKILKKIVLDSYPKCKVCEKPWLGSGKLRRRTDVMTCGVRQASEEKFRPFVLSSHSFRLKFSMDIYIAYS